MKKTLQSSLFVFIFLVGIKISNAQTIYTVAGSGLYGYNGDSISASSALLTFTQSVAIDSADNIYVGENWRIRKIYPSGIITTIAGTGVSGFSGDGGLAANAMIAGPYDVFIDRFGTIFFVDGPNKRIRKISTSGIITTIAGTGIAGYNGDGILATTARLNSPTGVIADTAGNIYIGDASNNRIRKIDAAGMISTYAGTGVAGFSGEGGPATAAKIYGPTRMCFDKFGNLYFADAGNHLIRKITPAGIITTVAGNGSAGTVVDGITATSSSLSSPLGVYVDTAMNMFIADASHDRIRKVNTAGIISTYAGTGVGGYTGDGGLATSAKIDGPNGVTKDKYGNVYFPDNINKVARKIVNVCVVPGPPTNTTTSSELNSCYGQTSILSVLDPGLIRWYAVPTGGTVLGTGFNYTTPVLYADTVFYADAKTCATSVSRTAFPIVINSNPTITATTDTTICNGTSVTLSGSGALSYTWTGGITNGISFSPSTTTNYTVTGSDTNGCGGTASTMVTVNTPNPAFTSSGAVLTANVTGAVYQWFNCGTNMIISGETNQNYTATGSGNFALIITENGCTDTSSCFTVAITGTNALSKDSKEFRIYPNPANDIFEIELRSESEMIDLKIFNTLGEVVLFRNESSLNSMVSVDISELPSGVYFINLSSASSNIKAPLIIQH